MGKETLAASYGFIVSFIVRVNSQNKNNPRRFIEDEHSAEAFTLEFKWRGATVF